MIYSIPQKYFFRSILHVCVIFESVVTGNVLQKMCFFLRLITKQCKTILLEELNPYIQKNLTYCVILPMLQWSWMLNNQNPVQPWYHSKCLQDQDIKLLQISPVKTNLENKCLNERYEGYMYDWYTGVWTETQLNRQTVSQSFSHDKQMHRHR